MRYSDFKKRFASAPLIFSSEVVKHARNPQAGRNQLFRWKKKGLIVQVKKGLYLFNPDERKATPSRFALAASLYSPSYVSMETALNLYGLIPERAADVTSVTTKKTTAFENEFGRFVYQHLKPQSFRGFILQKDEAGLPFFIAQPEKAVVDFFYFNLRRYKKAAPDIFTHSFRFQNTGSLRPAHIMRFARLFNNRKLLSWARDFCSFIKRG